MTLHSEQRAQRISYPPEVNFSFPITTGLAHSQQITEMPIVDSVSTVFNLTLEKLAKRIRGDRF